MPVPLNVTPALQSATCATNETWQCVSGTVRLFDYSPQSSEYSKGILLSAPHALNFPEGVEIYYLSEGDDGIIARIVSA